MNDQPAKPVLSPARLVFGMLIFLGFASVTAWIALINDKALNLFGIELSVNGATLLFWAMTTYLLGVAGFAAYRLITGK